MGDHENHEEWWNYAPNQLMYMSESKDRSQGPQGSQSGTNKLH
jgi:hypothetical protein